jgi:two-component system LytT family sensor kinase
MEAKQNKNLIILGLSTALLMSFFVVLPSYLLGFELLYSHFYIWLSILIQFLILWLIDFSMLTFLHYKWVESWVRIFISTSAIMVLNVILSYTIGEFNPFEGVPTTQLLLMRFVYFVLFNIMIFMINYLFITKEREMNNIKNLADLKFANLDAEYQLLKSQINPHFIFNALNISKSLIKSDPNGAEQYLIKLSEFLRESIHYDKKVSTVEEEIKLLENYIDLQKVRFGEAMIYKNNIDEILYQKALPHFALVTLAENIFKHNSFTTSKPIELILYNEADHIVVENTLIEKKVKKTTKAGLNNLSRRSRIVSGEDVQILKENGKFVVKIKLIDHENNNNRG